MVGHHLGAMLKSASAIGRAPGRNRGTAPGTTIRRRPDEAESTSPIRTLLKRASKLSLTSLLSSSSASSSAVALGVDGENNLPIGGNHPVIEIGGGGQGRLHRSASSSEYSTSLVEEGGDLRVLFLGCGDSGKTSKFSFQKQDCITVLNCRAGYIAEEDGLCPCGCDVIFFGVARNDRE